MNPKVFRTRLVSKLLEGYNVSSLLLFPDNRDSAKFISAKSYTAFLVTQDEAKIIANKFHEEQLEVENLENYEVEYTDEDIDKIIPFGDVMIASDTPYITRKIIKRRVVIADELFKRVLRKPQREEIEIIKEGVKILDRTFEKVMQEISIGMKESEVSDLIDSYFIRSGIENFAYRTIVVSGKRTSCPLARSTEKKIEKGDIILLDSSPIYKGYQIGIARTILTEENRSYIKCLELLNAALMKAMEIIKPGEKAKKLDLFCREFLSSKSIEYPHYTAVPMGGFYSPYAYPNSEDIFEINSIFFLTLGAYKKDFGMRIKHQIMVEKKPRILESFGTIK